MSRVEIQELKERVASLEEELRVSRIKEKSNEDKIKSLEKEIQDMKVKIEELEKENESLFIIVQIGHTTQRNMCEYVLGKDFKIWPNYKIKKINNYITRFVPQADQESARQRLKELNDEISWDEDVVDSLKKLKQTRNIIAHPKLSRENIKQATDFLRKKGELDEEDVDNIKFLKEQWEKSEALLWTSPAEGQDQGDPRNRSTTGQKHATYTRMAASELVTPLPPKRARKGHTSSSERQQDQHGQRYLSTTGQKHGTNARKADGHHHIPTKA